MRVVIPLSRRKGSLTRQVYDGLREAILKGAFAPGEKLPSTRDIAEQLGISRTVVLLAYEQLLAEGYTTGRGGSGTYVSHDVRTTQPAPPAATAQVQLSSFGKAAVESFPRLTVPRPRKPHMRYDFVYGRSDLQTFPFEMWRRILLRCARRAPVAEIDYGPPAGMPALQSAICAHLRRSRAVVCEPSQVMIVNGSQQALDLIARVLIERGDHVAMEDPGYQGMREVLRVSGARLHPVAIDMEGLDPAKIPAKCRMVFVTPSHQFPTGVILTLPRRLALLEWARKNNAVIIEDDYDGEFRYGGVPVESLQGLDQDGRVIYVGTFSRTVFSSLRIGYLIVPKPLMAAFTSAKFLCDRHTATLEQETLAEFITSGAYERYLRRVRRRNSARREALLGSIDIHLAGRVTITGDGAGAHIVLWPRTPVAETTIIQRAAEEGVRVYGISGYYENPPERTGILLGYARLNESEIREGIKRLGKVFGH